MLYNYSKQSSMWNGSASCSHATVAVNKKFTFRLQTTIVLRSVPLLRNLSVLRLLSQQLSPSRVSGQVRRLLSPVTRITLGGRGFWKRSIALPLEVHPVHMLYGNKVMYTVSHVFIPQKARSLNIHQLLAEESEDKLEEYYRQKYATTSSARLEVCDML